MGSTAPDRSGAGTLLGVAVAAARLAGDALRRSPAEDRRVVKAAGRDIKIAGDTRAEGLIVDHLRSQTPFPILSEERGRIAAETAEDPSRMWIVDPLDGSLNYQREIPLCCISIALYAGWEPVLGVVLDFNRDELFTGIVGAGAECNGRPIRPSVVRERREAVLATGFPVNRDFAEPALRAFIANVGGFKKVRLFGSAALSLSYVACGRVDAYEEENIMLWDVAGGCAILRAAGGRVEQRAGSELDRPLTIRGDNGTLDRNRP